MNFVLFLSENKLDDDVIAEGGRTCGSDRLELHNKNGEYESDG